MSEEVRKPETGSLLKVLEFTVDKTVALADAGSVLGAPMELEGMTIIPVSKVSVGFAGGGADITDVGKKKKQNPAGAGAQVARTPLCFLVLRDGEAKMLTVSGQEAPSSGKLMSWVAQQAKGLFRKDKGKKP